MFRRRIVLGLVGAMLVGCGDASVPSAADEAPQVYVGHAEGTWHGKEVDTPFAGLVVGNGGYRLFVCSHEPTEPASKWVQHAATAGRLWSGADEIGTYDGDTAHGKLESGGEYDFTWTAHRAHGGEGLFRGGDSNCPTGVIVLEEEEGGDSLAVRGSHCNRDADPEVGDYRLQVTPIHPVEVTPEGIHLAEPALVIPPAQVGAL